MREGEGLTQVQVAQRLGKPQSYVSKLESSERSLHMSEVFDYADALGIEVETFVGILLVAIKTQSPSSSIHRS